MSYLIDDVLSTVFSVTAVLLGLAVNGFIPLVNIKDWVTVRKMKPSDRILTVLCSTRFLLQFTFFLELTGISFGLIPLSAYAAYCITYVVELLLDLFSHWLSMWLCCLYYVKITTSKHPLILHLKSRIPGITKYALLLFGFLSFLTGLVYYVSGDDISCLHGISKNLTANRTFESLQERLMIAYFFGQAFPFMMEMMSSMYLLSLLVSHVKHTMSNFSSFKAPSMDAHWSLIRYILLLYFLSACNLVGNLLLWQVTSHSIGRSVGYFIIFSYPSFHSITLVLCNPKLKREMVKTFIWTRNVLCCFRGDGGFRTETVAQ
ncbi:bitter taste receptor 6 [Xenopus tropicalis]|uniref:Taste receptor type 2 n=1 Tax=Xenopus tropicalis TaxID=8364 RepID=Q2AB75_XENTR|nr:bitter taste receptor 6 [Xenopus tropicalis]BAE80392.1 bitter taste receptor [Xenopus tropicalis]|eukprot:NP_001165469.1 bitter taste receptor 6 [Xenopus tropicalis]